LPDPTKDCPPGFGRNEDGQQLMHDSTDLVALRLSYLISKLHQEVMQDMNTTREEVLYLSQLLKHICLISKKENHKNASIVTITLPINTILFHHAQWHVRENMKLLK
jgi:hypothetical protein